MEKASSKQTSSNQEGNHSFFSLSYSFLIEKSIECAKDLMGFFLFKLTLMESEALPWVQEVSIRP